MFHSRKTTLALSILVVALATFSTFAGTFHTRLDQPVAIGGQIFEGSVIELAPIPQGNTHAVLIDGQTAALVFRHAADRCPRSAQDAAFTFRADDDGLYHLTGIQWTDGDSGRIERRPFRIATVARGIATVSANGTLAREASLSSSR